MCDDITDDVSDTHNNQELGVDETRDDKQRSSVKETKQFVMYESAKFSNNAIKIILFTTLKVVLFKPIAYRYLF